VTKRRPKDINAYLRTLTPEKRAALTKLRKDIRSAMPKGEECISYGIPAFRLDGRVMVYFHAASKHCSFFPGARPIAVNASALKNYSTSKGTVRFAPARPLPATLVRKLVKARIAEHARRRQA
jgi:uncharacterized protein YdhG (YjbR/CyaY superfamily)